MVSVLNVIFAGMLVWYICKYIELKKSLKPREKRYLEIISALSSIIDRVEGYNRSHSVEVADFAVKIARKTSMDEDQITNLEIAAKLHDIGMLLITSDLFKSRHKLGEDDKFVLRSHPLLAEHYLKQEMSETDEIPTIIRWHHERWDGFGYPDSLRGEQIPIASRIISIADSVSAMRNQRYYRKKHYNNDEEIIAELKKKSGLQFDPSLVVLAISLLQSNESDKEI